MPPVVLTTWRFASELELQAMVRRVVDPYRHNKQIFESLLVSELLVERHYALKLHGDRYWPRLFRFDTHPDWNTPQYFTAEFALLGWRRISYRRAIWGWEMNDESLDGELAKHYRHIATPYVLAHRDRHPNCDVCGAPMRHVHHEKPTFFATAKHATGLLSADERALLIRTHNWFDTEQLWRLPDKCVRAIHELHQDAQLRSLCHAHHHAAHRR